MNDHDSAQIKHIGVDETDEVDFVRALKQAGRDVVMGNEIYGTLFNNMLNAMAYCKLVYENGHPVDYMYLAVNEAFVKQTGVADCVGKYASEVIPGLRETDIDMLQIYGRVVATGTPERFEYFINGLQMWVLVSVYSPKMDCFVAIFDVITERKQMESSLKQAQHQAKIFSWQWELSKNVPIWSDEMFHILGRDPTLPPVGWNEVQQYFTTESWTLVLSALKKCVAEGISFECDAKIVRPDGTQRSVVCRGEAKRDAKGDVVEIFGTVQDITERKQAEIHIERLNRFYTGLSRCNEAMLRCTSEEELFHRMCQLIVDIGGIKMAWIGLVDHASQRVNPVASYGNGVEYLEGIQVSVNPDDPLSGGPIGLAIRENQPQWFKDFGHDPRSAPWHESSARFGWNACAALPICRSGKPVGAMAFYSTGQGWSDEEVRKLLGDMAGNISFALDNFANESRRALAEKMLEQESRRNQAFLRNASDGVCIIDVDGNVLELSDSFQKMLGYSREELIGANISLWDVKWSPQELKQLIAEQIATEGRSILETQLRRRDGSFLDVEVTGQGLELDNKPVLFNSARDITERKQAEEKIQHYIQQLKTAFMSTVEVATTLSELRDPYTAGHERRVAEIAVAIGAELGFDESRQEGLRVAGFLHDIGKITIPSEILSKPGKLSEIERQMIQGHPQAGYDVLKKVEFPWPVAQVALQHHERMDGSGYPQGLKGEAILLEARILAVADVAEAMSSHRPYRPGFGTKKALAEIERGRGTSYDPAVTDICLRLFREKGYQLPT